MSEIRLEDVASIGQSAMNAISIPNEALDEKWLLELIAYVANEGYKVGVIDGRDQERFSS